MTEGAIIGSADWLKTPAGRYVLAWEQAHLDTALADLFGFHALQLGLPELDALRANRMPHRWVASDRRTGVDRRADGDRTTAWGDPWIGDDAEVGSGEARADDDAAAARIALHCDFDALPFDAASLDLIVLPHALEVARDPHRVLREVERALVPEGRVVIVGFNPSSPWGLRQRLERFGRDAPAHPGPELHLRSAGDFMRYGRLRDWLRLLGFEVEAGRFGCYRWPVGSSVWLERFAWMDGVGERWWPVFGAVYFVVAVKRVRGMRLVGTVRAQRQVASAAPAPVVAVQQHRQSTERFEKETG